MDRSPINTNANEARDTLLMELVEFVLARDVGQREECLETVLIRYPELYSEVKGRVQWEDRMQGFLCEPLMRHQQEEPDRPFRDGEVVGGRFRIVRELGRGGLGVVYEASDEKLHRRIALKCARRKFQSLLTPEARAVLEVSHPNVCKLHELHTAQTAAGPVDFLTMEFLEGETLLSRLEREGHLPPKEAQEIALQICAGLAQVHRQGVVHGDIKSGNVIVSQTPQGQSHAGARRAVVTDFGLSKLIVETFPHFDEAAGAAVSAHGGTLAYLAPELFAGSRATIASDIYALGVLFHLLLTGKVIGRRTSDVPVIVDLPSPWKKIVSRCIEVKAEARFASVDEIVAILTRGRAVVKWSLAASLVIIMILALFLLR